jgi:hypothetical protein
VRPCQGRSRGFNSRLPLHDFSCGCSTHRRVVMLSGPITGHSRSGRGTQVVRERSAKPLCVGSIPTRASNLTFKFHKFLPACWYRFDSNRWTGIKRDNLAAKVAPKVSRSQGTRSAADTGLKRRLTKVRISEQGTPSLRRPRLFFLHPQHSSCGACLRR